MIWDVHGRPACIVTLPIPSKREPAGEAFATAKVFCGCAQLAAPMVVATIAIEQRTDFIDFASGSILLSDALIFHCREFERVGDGGFPTHRTTFLCRFVGGLGSDPFPRWRQKLIFEIHPERNFVSEG
jgi:hypothetical protein